MINITKNITSNQKNKFHFSNRTNEQIKAEHFKTLIGKWKRECEITRCFDTIFEKVRIAIRPTKDDKDLIIQCSGLYLDYDKQKDIIGGCDRFTESEQIYELYQFIDAYLFHKFGLKMYPTSEAHGEFLFCIYDAYLKRGNRK